MNRLVGDRKRQSRVWEAASEICALLAVLLLAAFLRFTNLNWDEGQWIHPDEGHMRIITSVIQTPENLALYFDTDRSPLNSRNRGYEYSYGTLPLFLTRVTAEWLDQTCDVVSTRSGMRSVSPLLSLLVGEGGIVSCEGGSFTGSRSAEVGRTFSALAELGSGLLVFLIARRLYGRMAGLLSALLFALTVFSIQQAHFFTVDSMASFFTLLTAYFCVRAFPKRVTRPLGRASPAQRPAASLPWVEFALAGLATGFAAACKVSAGVAAALVGLAALAWLIEKRTINVRGWVGVFGCLVVAGLAAFLAFRVAQPYAFEGPGFFDIRPEREWLRRLVEIRAEQSGILDYPSGRQWANRAPLWFPWLNITIWGMGLPLGITAWVAWAYAGLRLFRAKELRHLVLWAWLGLTFLYLGTRWVKTMRYFLPLYPMLAIFAAYGLTCWVRSVRRGWRVLGMISAVVVVAGTAFWAAAFFSIYTRSHTRLAASRWMYEHVPEGSTIANEHWDWGLPLRVDGRDPFTGMYRGLELELYDEDTEEKRERLFRWLDEADYIIMASNRLYASIPRLPPRYPLTIAYYRLLLAEELGFELVADFTSYPALGPFVFPDQECPFPVAKADYYYQRHPIEVRLPPAEEAFSVYDHPRVLIFRKTASYSPTKVRQLLGAIDLSRVLIGLKPRQITAAPTLLEFDAKTWAEQQAGGTWSKMFHRDSLLNRYPGLAALVWWFVASLLGWAVFPLLFVVLPRLRDRGYGCSRALGLLLPAYLTWLLGSLRVMPNTRSTILFSVVLVLFMGGAVGWLWRSALCRFVCRQRRLIFHVEVAFALLYWLWIGVRLLNGDLWHPIVGGEKPMDFAYLNAVMKSTWFPPYNPWFSGSMINYYYFGFVIVGTFIKLIGTIPSIAYNLAVPLLFALTGVGAFSVAYNLFSGRRKEALLAGWVGLIFVVLLGNLGVVRLLRSALIAVGGELFPSTIPGYAETVAMLRGLWQVIVHGAKLPVRIESWYWYPTRIIPAAPHEAGPITEFPAFTFLYADLHAHMIAFPLTLFALILAIYWARTPRPSLSSLLVGGLVIGALYPTNTWDFPTYMVLGLTGLGMGAVHSSLGPMRGLRWASLKPLLWRWGILVASAMLLYLPYIRNYAAGYSSVEIWRGTRTPVELYFWIHGVLLFPLLTRMGIELYWLVRRAGVSKVLFPTTVGVAVVAVLTFTLVLAGCSVALFVVPFASGAALAAIVARAPVERRLLWLWASTAALLSLLVEVVVLKGDISRMNTVFKFYLQVWMLLSVTAAASVAWIWVRCSRWKPSWRLLWKVGLTLLVAGGALFLPFGIWARAVDRMAPGTGLTLDGMAYMRGGYVVDGDPSLGEPRLIPLSGDYAAIRWLQDHIEGSPVIIEGLGYREYLWANRVSIYTGLPAVIGWRWHQVQQRAMLPDVMVDWRRADVQQFYQTPDVGLAGRILERYGVRYVYVGEYERAYARPSGIGKFAEMVKLGMLQVVYDAEGVQIYRVLSYEPAPSR